MSVRYLIAIITIVIAISFITYKMIITKMNHLRETYEKRLVKLSETDAGRLVLANEYRIRNEKQKKIIPFILIGFICSYAILLFAGIGGLYVFIEEVLKQSDIIKIIQVKNGYFLLSPVIIIYSLYKIVQTLKLYNMK